MSEELKACPYCGEHFLGYTTAHGPHDGQFQMVCGCGARGPATPEKSVVAMGAAWNLRTPDWQHDEAWHKDYEGRLLADAQRTSEELIEMRALAQELADALYDALYDASLSCSRMEAEQYMKILDKARKAGLDV